jgi:hypothetical protein
MEDCGASVTFESGDVNAERALTSQKFQEQKGAFQIGKVK